MTILNGESEKIQGDALEVRRLSSELLEECIRISVSSDDPGYALEQLLACLGRFTGSDRVFIFELSEAGDRVNNTHEWCRQGVHPEIQLLQDMAAEDTELWFQMLQKEPFFAISDIEDLRLREPGLYSGLKAQNIRSGAAGRVMNGEKLAGFWGFDNLEPRLLPVMIQAAQPLERIFETLVRSRNIRTRLQDVELRDPATGLYNLRAMYIHHQQDENPRTMAVVYARMEEGPDLEARLLEIRTMRDQIYRLVDSRRIYRISPTEFVTVYTRVDRERVDRWRKGLKLRTEGTRWKLRIGSAWTDRSPIQLDDLIREAMRWSCLYGASDRGEQTSEKTPLEEYLERNYFDMEFFLNGLTQNNDSACFFFGDMQEELFYISENMRRKFGFSGTLVPKLYYAWGDRIEGQRAKQRFYRDLQDVLDQKRDSFNLYNQVLNASGNREWVHLYGLVKWNQDRTAILFCTGRISMQDKNLSMDEITGFSMEPMLARHLARIQKGKAPCYFVGFSLNAIARINDMEGRAYGNSLIRSISEALSQQLYDRAAFYKLSGMRFAALIRPEYALQKNEIIEQIRFIIEEKYNAFEIRVPNACSFVLTSYPQERLEPLDFIENINSCIKLVQQEGGKECMDGTRIDFDRVRANANLSLELSRDVLSQMRNFRMVVQPVVETRDSRIKGGEALLRWRNQGKDVSPGFFIPILEKDNMIIRVGRWVFEESVKACRRMLTLDPDFRLSINISLQQLDDEGLMAFIERTMEKYQVSGSHLILEMTESCMDSAQEKLMQFVLFCSEHGILVSLDDFGTGYSSIRVLMQYPTTIIKLDRSLLLEMGKSMDKKNFISSIVFACHQFGKRVCIEGVETLEQDQMVREASCDMIQGFYYYRPMELDDVYALLARQKQDREHPDEAEI